MSFAIAAVQQALYSKLTGDGVLMGLVNDVFDVAPQQSPLPYIVVGGVSQEAIVGIARAVWRVNLVLDVWTEAGGRKTALTVLERLKLSLHHGSMVMTGFELMEMRAENASCELAHDATKVLGSIELELIVAET